MESHICTRTDFKFGWIVVGNADGLNQTPDLTSRTVQSCSDQMVARKTVTIVAGLVHKSLLSRTVSLRWVIWCNIRPKLKAVEWHLFCHAGSRRVASEKSEQLYLLAKILCFYLIHSIFHREPIFTSSLFLCLGLIIVFLLICYSCHTTVLHSFIHLYISAEVLRIQSLLEEETACPLSCSEAHNAIVITRKLTDCCRWTPTTLVTSLVPRCFPALCNTWTKWIREAARHARPLDARGTRL